MESQNRVFWRYFDHLARRGTCTEHITEPPQKHFQKGTLGSGSGYSTLHRAVLGPSHSQILATLQRAGGEGLT
jgi:hypothetical protein